MSAPMSPHRCRHPAGSPVRRLPAGSAGQATAELAMLLPVVLLVILAVVQFALVARDYVSIHHAAREAARRAAVQPVRATAMAAASGSSPALVPERLGVRLRGGRNTGDLLTVELHYRSPTAVPVVGALTGDISMSARAVVRIE